MLEVTFQEHRSCIFLWSKYSRSFQNHVHLGTGGIFAELRQSKCRQYSCFHPSLWRWLILCVTFFLSSLTWTLFFIFTFLHLYANFRAVSSVIMETVNMPRLHILVNEFLSEGRIMTPEEVGSREPVVFGKFCTTQHP